VGVDDGNAEEASSAGDLLSADSGGARAEGGEGD